jgi:adenosylcobinamide-phosphate synthase
VPLLIIWLAAMVDHRLAFAINVFWCWQIFAARSLKKESMRVYEQIEKGDISLARKFLSWIVGRDTGSLDFREITKAVVETIAENTSDGVTAPMLFMIIGGAPLGFFYKAANTLDSMVGYKNDKYLYFGRTSAKFDDVLNFIPARITGLAMVAAAWLTGMDGRNSMKMFRRDRLKHVSPNSGNLEAACAGALDIQLGGDACYFGKLYKKETLGDPLREAEPDDIKKTVRLMYGASVLLLVIMEAVRIGLVALF